MWTLYDLPLNPDAGIGTRYNPNDGTDWSLGVKTYGPPLNKATAAGSDEVMRAFIVNGTDRMPAFKYYLKPAEIDAIIAYVRTVPVPAAPAPSAQK